MPRAGRTGKIANEEVIEGRNPVLEAINSGRPINKILLAKDAHGEHFRTIMALAKEKHIPVQLLEKEVLNRHSSTGMHQGLIAYAAPLSYYSLEELFQRADRRKEPPLFMLLDGVEDPHNLGSIIRSVEVFGGHGVIVPERRAVGLTPTVVRSSAGAANHLPLARVKNIVRAMTELKERGCWLLGADPAGETIWTEKFDLAAPLCLVLGGEGRGLGRLVKENCDLLVGIPMKGKVNSLNVSVAAGVLLAEVMRRRYY
ncbi:MAG TPA: 23S rRNA (guanosine(2251)-2'-O)-methyltransferase RlmB [Firmicutes bacterium]|nr:23S rRNA (guanosine(2251)-2'-O)-methyltransferase RlmB [Bacillota bacterium]